MEYNNNTVRKHKQIVKSNANKAIVLTEKRVKEVLGLNEKVEKNPKNEFNRLFKDYSLTIKGVESNS